MARSIGSLSAKRHNASRSADRRKLEASQSKFGKMIGADQALVSIWESGSGKPGPQYTAKIAALLRERGISGKLC
jgi:DNA-binding transcriptional regulator YiaG